jgi:hypothetical protein
MNYRRGWFGHSHEHSLARRGIRRYNADKDATLVNPTFYAQKREEEVSFATLMDETRSGSSYQDLCRKHPNAEKESLRVRGIKAVESRDGNNVLSTLNNNGVDESVRMAEHNGRLRDQMLETLQDRQKASFLQDVKVGLLKDRLRGAR